MQSQFIVRDTSAADLRFNRLQFAPASLSPNELLRDALGLTKKKSDALLGQMGQDLTHPLSALRQVDPTALDSLDFTPKEISRTLATLQLARRLYSPVPEALPLESPEAAVAYLAPDLMWETQEKFAILMLDVKNRPIGQRVLTVGTATETLAHPRDIFGCAMRSGATRLMVAHNHPSGSTQPSKEDITLTRQLLEGAQTLGIPLLDHLILGCGSFTSLRQNTCLWEEYPQGM